MYISDHFHRTYLIYIFMCFRFLRSQDVNERFRIASYSLFLIFKSQGTENTSMRLDVVRLYINMENENSDP